MTTEEQVEVTIGEAPSAAAVASFTYDDSPTNEFGERRFVDKLKWFGPVNMMMVLAGAIPTSGVSGLVAYNFTHNLGEGAANGAIDMANVGGAFAGAIASFVAGNLSDHTRTWMGRRNPWIIAGAAMASLATLGLAFVDFGAIWPVIALFCLFQPGLNTMLAAYSALLPDRISSKLMGRASAWAALGTLVGTASGGIIVAILVNTFGIEALATGFLYLPWIMIAMAALIVIALPGAHLKKDPTAAKPTAKEIGAPVIEPLVSAVTAEVGSASAELVELFRQMPLVKLTACGMGFGQPQLQAMIAAVDAQLG